MIPPTPKFQKGDRVRVKKNADLNLVGTIVDVDASKLVVHYDVIYNGHASLRQRLAEFDLAPIGAAAPAPVVM